MKRYNRSCHKEFALLNPQFRDLNKNDIEAKILALKTSREASDYIFTIDQAIRHCSNIADIEVISRKLECLKITEIFVSHEGSLTGAPVVSRNIVDEFSKNGTPLLISFGQNDAFRNLNNTIVLNFHSSKSRIAYWGYLLGIWLIQLGCISSRTKIIGSTIESSDFLIGVCDALNRGSCTLLHEHPYYYGVERLERLLAASQKIIYSSDYVLNGWITALKSDADKYFFNWQMTKQAQPIQSIATKRYDMTKEATTKYITADSDKLAISGAGHIQPRKGVHLFLEIIAEIARSINKYPNLSGKRIVATWVGKPKNKTEYTLYIESKANWLAREFPNLEINILAHCSNYIEHIQDSDIFLCPSTVDPLPNVVLDALQIGVPAFILKGCNGHEDSYRSHGLSELIMEPSCIESSANTCLSLVNSSVENQRLVKRKISQLLSSYPSHSEYAKIVKKQAKLASLIYLKISKSSSFTIKSGWESVLRKYGSYFVPYQFPERQTEYGALVAGLHNYWGCPSRVASPLTAKYDYKRLIAKFMPKDRASNMPQPRREMAVIIDPQKEAIKSEVGYDVHIHSFYPDICEEILHRIELLPKLPRKVLITYPRGLNKETINLQNSTSLDLDFVETPNIGRNIIPLKHINGRIESDYLVHLHTKKSLHSNPKIIEAWNKYLLSTLIGKGGSSSRLINILDTMVSKSIKLAYPLEPTYQHLGRNAAGMNNLLRRLHKHNIISGSLNDLSAEMFYSYPCGLMFVASKDFVQTILAPMISVINYDEVKEPLPYDGTMLHAAERCIPLLATINECDIGFILPPSGITR